jgi:hypothetical protein
MTELAKKKTVNSQYLDYRLILILAGIMWLIIKITYIKFENLIIKSEPTIPTSVVHFAVFKHFELVQHYVQSRPTLIPTVKEDPRLITRGNCLLCKKGGFRMPYYIRKH